MYCNTHAPMVAISPNKGLKDDQNVAVFFNWSRISPSLLVPSKSKFLLLNESNLKTH